MKTLQAAWQKLVQDNGVESVYEAAQSVTRLETEPAPRYDCGICHDKGLIKYDVETDDPRFGKIYPCPIKDCPAGQIERAAYWQRRYARARIPDEYLELSFKTWLKRLTAEQRKGKWLGFHAAKLFAERAGKAFTLGEVYEAAKLDPQAAPNGGKTAKSSLVLYGPAGTGKTGLACNAVRELANNESAFGVPPAYMSYLDFVKAVQAGYSTNTAEQTVSEFQAVPIFVLDELRRTDKDDRLEMLFRLIDYRDKHGKATLVTTNDDPDELESVWGAPFVQRLRNMAHFVKVGGVHLRKIEPPAVEDGY